MELSVGNILRDHGWAVEHSPLYTDPESGKAREIDICATVHADQVEEQRWVSVGLVIECKRTLDRPWVAFTAPRDTTMLQVVNSIVADEFSRDLLYSVPPEVGLPPFLCPSNRIAHSVTRAFGAQKAGDPTGPYSALRGAMSAAIAIGAASEELSIASSNEILMADLLLPVVVIDGALFDFSITGTEEESLVEAPWIQTTIAGPTPGSVAIVTIITRSAFPDYLAALTPAAQGFALAMVAHVDKAREMTRRRRTRVSVLRAGGPDLFSR
ncbi:MAG TPA: hypothetical protein VEY93_12180 [Longimicrobium sp.]|nr:hypothetical protein [Longimicrobium sp.]